MNARCIATGLPPEVTVRCSNGLTSATAAEPEPDPDPTGGGAALSPPFPQPTSASATRSLFTIATLSPRAHHVRGHDPRIELLAGDEAERDRGVAQRRAVLVRV